MKLVMLFVILFGEICIILKLSFLFNLREHVNKLCSEQQFIQQLIRFLYKVIGGWLGRNIEITEYVIIADLAKKPQKILLEFENKNKLLLNIFFFTHIIHPLYHTIRLGEVCKCQYYSTYFRSYWIVAHILCETSKLTLFGQKLPVTLIKYPLWSIISIGTKCVIHGERGPRR